MNKSLKTLAVAAVASAFLLACDDTGTNVGSINCKTQPALTSVAAGGNIINLDVKEWMASGSKEKKKVHISDMHRPQVEAEYPGASCGSYSGSPNTPPSAPQCSYSLNGREISAEQYSEYLAEYEKEMEEAREARKSSLEHLGEVEITAENLSKFLENNSELSVSFPGEAIDLVGGEAASPCN